MAASNLVVGYFYTRGGWVRQREVIKQLARKKGVRARELLAMAPLNDPFYIGSPKHYANAEWARGLYHLLSPPGPIHIRHLHYFALTQPDYRKPNGQVYTNIESNWKFLGYACKFARYLNLLPYDAFIDRRNPWQPAYGKLLGQEHYRCLHKCLMVAADRFYRWQLQFVTARLLPVHIEIWVEKSTAADLLEPIARKYHVNVVASMGDISVTSVWEFFKRIARCRKPVRIFHISDFDPSGTNMPVSVARKIEFLLRQHKLSKKIDIKLKSLMLNRQQCAEFALPAMPLSGRSRRNVAFMKFHGRSSTELHALEVARPGYICKVVDEQLRKYFDPACLQRVKKLAERIKVKVLPIGCAFDKKNNTGAPLVQELKQNNTRSFDERDERWLFDSSRDYISQLIAYNSSRGDQC